VTRWLLAGVFLLHTTKDLDVTLAELVAVVKLNLREDTTELPSWSGPGAASESKGLLDAGPASLRDMRSKRATVLVS